MKDHLNLLSLHARRQQSIRDARLFWSKIVAALALVMLPIGFVQWQLCDSAAQRQSVAELQCDPVRTMRAENTRIQQQIAELRINERVPLALSQRQSVLALIGLVSRGVRAHGGSVYLEQMELEQDPLAGIAGMPSHAKFALAGIGRERRAVTRFADSLRTHRSFRHVNVDSQESNRSAAPGLQTFNIECEL